MTVETRVKMVYQDFSMTVCNGGNCLHEKAAEDAREGWISFKQPHSFGTWDFCSYRCLAEWAARQAEKADEAITVSGEP